MDKPTPLESNIMRESLANDSKDILFDGWGVQASQAISLKRIADTLEHQLTLHNFLLEQLVELIRWRNT